MTRFAVKASGLSLVAVLGLAGCSGGPGTSTPAPAEVAHAPALKTEAETPKHGPARWFFRQVSALDLRDDQRARVTAIQEELHAEMTPHREAIRQALLALADAVELGKLDAEKAEEQKALLASVIVEAKASFADAINGVHDTLDSSQRFALVQALKEQHEGHAREGGPKHGLAKLAYAVGLTEAQQTAIADSLQQGLDELVPQRKARREAWETKMKAMGEAFVTDDFDAADFDMADHSVEALTSGMQMASRAVDVSNDVLSDGQRRLAADWVRERAQEL